MRRVLASIGAAFAYFSILPVPRSATTISPRPDSLAALPIVGVAIGGLSGIGATIVARFAPGDLSVATAFGLSIALSGAIHVDGFLDCSDALFATVDPARRLEILKDPHHGSFAVAAMATLSAFWLAALETCPPRRLPSILAYAAALARYAAIANAAIPVASEHRSTEALKTPLRADLLVVEAGLLLIVARTLGPRVWSTLPLALIASTTMARSVARRFGGLTGDGYGFLIVTLEPAIVAVTAALARERTS